MKILIKNNFFSYFNSVWHKNVLKINNFDKGQKMFFNFKSKSVSFNSVLKLGPIY